MFNQLSYWEHCETEISENEALGLKQEIYTTSFPKKKGDNLPCYTLTKGLNSQYHLETGYFIGVDWIEKDKKFLHVAPKLNFKLDREEIRKKSSEIDFIQMLFASMRHDDISKEIDELFLIKWDDPKIEIEQKQDLLTPFLVVEFLGLLKTIVRKGLKKSYYKVERNLHSRVKGKVMVAKSIKRNLLQNKNLYTTCQFDEFGVNNKENRLLNKALVFIKHYLPVYSSITNSGYLANTFNYVSPAFQTVSEEIELHEIKYFKTNAFYKEYERAMLLARLILKRFGYNISNTAKQKILTPPFWIDMSKLFELYVLGLLKDRFHNEVKYHFIHYGNELDYILNSEEYKMVVDAKYKPKYIYGKYDEDIRQVSGYARLGKVYKYLDKTYPESIDCLIVYPDLLDGYTELKEVDLNNPDYLIPSYNGVFKVGVKLPIIE